jgi:alkaline phosphatase/alkaline phosphatase D
MRDNTPLDLRRPAARTEEQLRKKWHEQFVQPRFVELFSQVPVYFQKDDHDFRYNDCDAFTEQAPSSELGARIFLEQVPLADPEGDPKTYRTHRINELLQIWLTEGRDYRTPSTMPDGPEKTLWGREQSVWLKKTLSESDAKFKLLISPTPLIGPDGANRRDNHSGLLGYSHERDEFLGWLLSYDSIREGFYIICGDRHWQYHSISPKGFDEFSCGALNDENALVGRRPGDPASNDPNGRITQPFHPQQKSGGFLYVEVVPAHDHLPDTLSFSWYDDNGTLLHRTSKLGEK